MVLKAEFSTPDLFNGLVKIKSKEGTSLPVARIRHSAVFHNGVIYVGGGSDTKKNPLFTVDIYHPDTDKWDAMDTPHALFAMSVLKGKVVIVGGQTKKMLYFWGGSTTNKVLVLENREWKDYATMPTARLCATTVCHQSLMIVIGGYDGERMIASTELFDNSTSQWFKIKCDNLQQLHSSQSLIIGDKLYVVGGISSDGTLSTSVYAACLDTLYSHQLKWQRLVDTPGINSAAVGVNNKYVLAVGGLNETDILDGDTDSNDYDDDDDEDSIDNDDDIEDEEGTCYNKIFTLNSTSTTWSLTASVPQMKAIYAAVAFDNNNSRLVIIGGFDEKWKYADKVFIVSFQ